jgi:hypothetical protein
LRERVSSVAKFTWHEPRWYYVPRHWRALREILNPRSLTRVGVVSALVGVVIVGAFKLAIPQFVIPNNFGWIVLALPGMVLYLLFNFALLVVFPPTITLRDRTLQRTHSQAGPKIKPENLRSAWLTVHAGDRIRLKLRYRVGKLDRTQVIGVPSGIDLNTLVQLLPQEPIVRDARWRRIPTAGQPAVEPDPRPGRVPTFEE